MRFILKPKLLGGDCFFYISIDLPPSDFTESLSHFTQSSIFQVQSATYTQSSIFQEELLRERGTATNGQTEIGETTHFDSFT